MRVKQPRSDHHRGQPLLGRDRSCAADLHARVPSCPDWTITDLAPHLLGVHIFVDEIVAHPATIRCRPSNARPSARSCHSTRPTWWRSDAETLQRMVDVLRSADPQQRRGPGRSQHDVAFVTRHQVQEAAVHRWDAQTATGIAVDPIARRCRGRLHRRVPDPEPAGVDPGFAAHCRDRCICIAPMSTASGSSTRTDESSRSTRRATSRCVARPSDLLLALYSRVPLDHST